MSWIGLVYATSETMETDIDWIRYSCSYNNVIEYNSTYKRHIVFFLYSTCYGYGYLETLCCFF